MRSHILRGLAAFTGVIFLFAAPPLPARADAAAATLLAKHKTFVGWQFGDGSIRTLRLTGETLKDSDASVYSTTKESRVGLINRIDTTGKNGTDYEGFTGRVFWNSDENGFTRASFGDPAKYRASVNALFDEGTQELTGAMRPAASLSGQSLSVVRVDVPNAFPIDLYVDPLTGEYKRAVFDPGGDREATLDILAYAEALPGKKVISKWKYLESKYTHQYRKIIANTEITNQDLHPPAQTATWTFTNRAPFPITVTDHRIVVDAKVNGVDGKFILDSGASSIFLTSAFAQKAHVKTLDTSSARGIAGELAINRDRAQSIEIGGNTINNVRLDSGGSAMDRAAPDGLMGFDFLAGAIVTVDFNNQQMTIADPSTAQVDSGSGIPVIADLTNGTPVVTMKLNGGVDVNAMLDSGNPVNVLYASDLVQRDHVRMMVDDTQLDSELLIGGISGRYEVGLCGHLETLALGPVVYQNPPACQSPSFSGRDILVGLDFLKGFNSIVFDYPESKLIMIPNK